MRKIAKVTACCLLFAGCEDNSDNHSQSPLVGPWVTESCEQVMDSDGTLLNFWARGLYEFTLESTVRWGIDTYSDANCVTVKADASPSEMDPPATYIDKGPEVLQEGIEGAALTIEMGHADQRFTGDGFYTINNGSLCFSDLFRLEAARFGLSSPGATAINFTRCLTRQ